MKIDDRSEIEEHLICQLWERKYFSSIPLTTTTGEAVEIISLGRRNFDAGPDFKNISIKLDGKIFHGDLEIHRAPEDWYQHKHHADPAYNNVIMHLIIGKTTNHEHAVNLNRRAVLAEVFTEIPEEKFPQLAKKYQLNTSQYFSNFICQLSEKSNDDKLSVINYFARERFFAKVERFLEEHQSSAWNQVLYVGIMEALGYSKNQLPFRKLANLLPFQALSREFQSSVNFQDEIQLQALLFGVAGLLPSQDPSFDWKKVKDKDTQNYIEKIESLWKNFSHRIGLKPMKRDEWLFFRLRPSNFPTRRIAGASFILGKFINEGILEKNIRIIAGLVDSHSKLIKELERCFIIRTTGYWASHYKLEQKASKVKNNKSVTLIGRERARSIVINTILPVIFAYAKEIEDSQQMVQLLQLYQQYPKAAPNSITKKMGALLFDGDEQTSKKLINTSAKQQGLIHLYKLYCRRRECDRCREDWQSTGKAI